MLTVTDLFAGAGGSSTGMVSVPGVRVVMAANHWKVAIDIHNANHPDTDHAAVDLHQEDPAYFPRTDVLWASPECTKWSQANGSARPAIDEGLFEDPLSDDAATRSRLLMFDVLRFAEHHRYRMMIVENVVDIATQVKYRTAWAEWRRQLHELGYDHLVVSLNSMHAATFGDPAPQSRDRIYIVCWRRGERAPDMERVLRPRAFCPSCAEWVESRQSWKDPRKTVGRYLQSYLYRCPKHSCRGQIVEPPWMPAAAAIDWTIPGERIGDRDKPLKPKTMLRIAHGIARYWGPLHIEEAGNQYDAADPKHPQHGGLDAYYRAWPVAEYLRTLTTVETRALAVPVEGRDGKSALPLGLPGRTQTTRLETALAHQPFISEFYGTAIGRPVTEPAATFTAGGNKHGLVTTAGGSWNDEARPTTDPMRTLTTRDAYALVHRNNSGGAEMTTPVFEELRTLTAAGHQALLQQPERRKATPKDLEQAREMVPDVLFRMFRPHEVAAGMAFPSDYDWQPDPLAKISNRDLTKAAGNAVTPPASRDLMVPVLEALTGEEAT